jgi:hypothetical protein
MNTTHTKKIQAVTPDGQQLIKPGMMSIADAKKYIEHENWLRYRSLGGTMKWNDYRYCAATFVRMTIDIFVGGDPKFFDSRQEAVGWFQVWMNLNGYRDNYRRIFQSIDDVHSYT